MQPADDGTEIVMRGHRPRHAARDPHAPRHPLLHDARRRHRPRRGAGPLGDRPARRHPPLRERAGAGDAGPGRAAPRGHGRPRCRACCSSTTSRRCAALKELVEDRGQPLVARSGAEALDARRAGRRVLTDSVMPGMDGLELLRARSRARSRAAGHPAHRARLRARRGARDQGGRLRLPHQAVRHRRGRARHRARARGAPAAAATTAGSPPSTLGRRMSASSPRRCAACSTPPRGSPAATSPCWCAARPAPARSSSPRCCTRRARRAGGPAGALQLRGHPRRARRGRAVRPRARRVHRRHRGPGRVLRARPTAARWSSTRSASCRWRSRPSSCARCRRARSSRSAPGASRRSTCASSPRTNRDLAAEVRSRPLPRGPLLPARGGRAGGAAAARAARGHPGARRTSSRAATASGSASGRSRSSPRWSTRWSRADWPGNVRQLENTIARLARPGWRRRDRAGGLRGDHRRGAPRRRRRRPSGPAGDAGCGRPLREQVESLERGVIARTLTAVRGNQSEAARRLGTSRNTLTERLRRYGIAAEFLEGA